MVSKRTRHQKSTVTREKPNHFPPLSYSPVSVQPSWAQWRRDSNLVCMYMRYSLSEGHYRMRFTEAGKLTENFIFSVFQVMRHATPQPLAFITTTSYYNSAFQENIVEALKKKILCLEIRAALAADDDKFHGRSVCIFHRTQTHQAAGDHHYCSPPAHTDKSRGDNKLIWMYCCYCSHCAARRLYTVLLFSVLYSEILCFFKCLLIPCTMQCNNVLDLDHPHPTFLYTAREEYTSLNP